MNICYNKIYNALQEIKKEYEPAKHLSIKELSIADEGILIVSVKDIKNGMEHDTFNLLLNRISNLLVNNRGVASAHVDNNGAFWFVAQLKAEEFLRF